jgi:hypothetical protein
MAAWRKKQRSLLFISGSENGDSEVTLNEQWNLVLKRHGVSHQPQRGSAEASRILTTDPEQIAATVVH